MPNSLTEKWLPGNLFDDEDHENKIKQDLEEVDDVFAANVWSSKQEEHPAEEWLETSSEGTPERRKADFDLSQDISIKQMKLEKENLIKDVDGDQY
jgi:hypothetical protein